MESGRLAKFVETIPEINVTGRYHLAGSDRIVGVFHQMVDMMILENLPLQACISTHIRRFWSVLAVLLSRNVNVVIFGELDEISLLQPFLDKFPAVLIITVLGIFQLLIVCTYSNDWKQPFLIVIATGSRSQISSWFMSHQLQCSILYNNRDDDVDLNATYTITGALALSTHTLVGTAVDSCGCSVELRQEAGLRILCD